MNSSFTRLLMDWHFTENSRKMPWKGEKDPYKIWLSEIILQQTRVEQGLDYYNRFVDAFPTVRHLAEARDEKVFKLWEGLGYYARCRNLLHTARVVHKDHGGVFPDTYNQIIQLKGIGPYTASAIASFAFGLPYAVVDGNVMRVLSRVFGISEPVDGMAGKKKLNELAEKLLDKDNPDLYNQAIMDFGAVVCKPAIPLCNTCSLQQICVAFQREMTDLLPVKMQKIKRRKRWMYYFLLEKKQQVLVRERQEKDIWRHLNEFVLVETSRRLSPEKLLKEEPVRTFLNGQDPVISSISGEFKQQLTHQEIQGRFIRIHVPDKFSLPLGYKWVKWKDLENLAFPKYILSYLKENG